MCHCVCVCVYVLSRLNVSVLVCVLECVRVWVCAGGMWREGVADEMEEGVVLCVCVSGGGIRMGRLASDSAEINEALHNHF